MNEAFWSSDKLTGNQTRFCHSNTLIAFWSSDKLTGNQTVFQGAGPSEPFWSSDKLTGNQTELSGREHRAEFWSSDKLTGNQTRSSSHGYTWRSPFSVIPWPCYTPSDAEYGPSGWGRFPGSCRLPAAVQQPNPDGYGECQSPYPDRQAHSPLLSSVTSRHRLLVLERWQTDW